MLRRKFEDRLIQWKADPDRMSLLVPGARQVGKTFSINRFGEDNYRNYLKINFEREGKYCDAFAGDLEPSRIVPILEQLSGTKLIPGESLIFLDEIQACPRARAALKFFTEDGEYDVIASGSLLGVDYGKVPSYPVGYETRMELPSLDFEEFLWARGTSPEHISGLREKISSKEPLGDALYRHYTKLFREYIVVGGMPAAVREFVSTGSLLAAQNVQGTILEGYSNDAGKYSVASDRQQIRECMASIPRQLAKENKKFVYSEVGEGEASRRRYGGALEWIRGAGIASFCHNLHEPALPLVANVRDNMFKVYVRDTGLLVRLMGGSVAASVVAGDTGVNKGGVLENAVADQFVKCGIPLYYFSRKSYELDFIIDAGEVTAVEVKSGNNRMSKSLDSALNKYGICRRIKLEDSDIHVDADGVEHYPLFVSGFMDSVIGKPLPPPFVF